MSEYVRKTSDPLHLFRKYHRTGDETIRNRLIKRYLYLVKGIASRIHSKMPLDVFFGDVVSAGVFGLIDAIKSFDIQRGTAFGTHAGKRVRGAILDWARDQDFVPRLTRDRSRKLDAAATELFGELGRRPYPHELAKKLGLTAEEFEKFETGSRVRQIGSLSHVVASDEYTGKELTQCELLADPKSPDPADDPNHTSLRDVLLKYGTLSQALLIRLYYVDDLTMKQIGEALGHSESRISQLHTTILKALKGRFGNQLREMLTGRAA